VRNKFAIVLAAVGLMGTGSAAMAHHHEKPGNLDIRSGFGEEIMVRHGLFGTEETMAKDRLGDGYIKKHGLFGTGETGVNVFGNSYVKHKGLLGGTQVEASSIFGDRIESKKGFLGLGRRQTSVDLGGVGTVVQGLFANHKNAFVGMGAPMGIGQPVAPDSAALARMPGGVQGVRPSWSPAGMPTNDLDAAAGLNGGARQQNP